MGIISSALRKSAQGEACTLQIVGVCTGMASCLCHLRVGTAGMGVKDHDFVAVFGCNECHQTLDQHHLSKADEAFYSLRALVRTWARWIERGFISLPVDPQTAKRRPKRPAKMSSRKIQSRPFQKRAQP